MWNLLAYRRPKACQGRQNARPVLLLAAQQRFQRGRARLGGLALLAAVAAIGLLQQWEGSFEHLVLLGLQGLQRLRTVADLRFLELAEASAGRNQVSEDDVLLQTDKVINLAGERSFGEHLRRFLEAG